MPLHHMSDLNSLLKCRFLLQAVMQLRIGRTSVQTNGSQVTNIKALSSFLKPSLLAFIEIIALSNSSTYAELLVLSRLPEW